MSELSTRTRSNFEYFKASYAENKCVREKLWKDDYIDNMLLDAQWKGTVKSNKQEGGQKWFKQQADYIWKRVLNDEQKKEWKNESLALKKLLEEKTENTTQIEGQPNAIVSPPSYEDRKDEHPQPPEKKEEKKNPDIVLQPNKRNENNPGNISEDLKTGDHKYCTKCNWQDIEDHGWPFCPMCREPLSEPLPPENILKKTIPGISNVIIFQKQDEKKIHKSTIKELNDMRGRLNYYCNPYNNKDGSNYMSLGSEENNILKAANWMGMGYFVPENDTIEHILTGLIAHEISNPICRRELIVKTNVNWWNERKNPGESIEIRYAPEIANISDGIQLQRLEDGLNKLKEGHHNFNLEKSGDDMKTSIDISLETILSNIKEDIYYSESEEKIFTWSTLMEELEFESQYIEDLNPKKHSRTFKILNINVYILNEEMNILFDYKHARERKNKITTAFKLKKNIDDDISEILTGFKSHHH